MRGDRSNICLFIANVFASSREAHQCAIAANVVILYYLATVLHGCTFDLRRGMLSYMSCCFLTNNKLTRHTFVFNLAFIACHCMEMDNRPSRWR